VWRTAEDLGQRAGTILCRNHRKADSPLRIHHRRLWHALLASPSPSSLLKRRTWPRKPLPEAKRVAAGMSGPRTRKSRRDAPQTWELCFILIWCTTYRYPNSEARENLASDPRRDRLLASHASQSPEHLVGVGIAAIGDALDRLQQTTPSVTRPRQPQPVPQFVPRGYASPDSSLRLRSAPSASNQTDDGPACIEPRMADLKSRMRTVTVDRNESPDDGRCGQERSSESLLS